MIGAGAPGPDDVRAGKGRSQVLSEYSQEELIVKWEEFFAEMGYESAIIGLADRYPEARSLKVRFDDLNRFDTDMSIHLLRHPLNVLAAGEEAIRRIVPPTEEAVEIHLRILGLPRDSRVQIRDLRAKHLGRSIAVEGLVRKATEVRPMVVDALFQCLRCGTVTKEPQEGQAFREPLECYEDQGGCGKSASSTKFKLLSEASRFLDTQKIEIQEAPEGLRGGEEPQRLAAFMEDDLTGQITPGMRVILNGILRSSQKGRPGQRSTLFDIFLDTNSIELEQVEFEEIEVTEEDIKRIEAEAAEPDIFQKIVASIAPSIYGLSTEKEALALQLFSGVPKLMPDGRRIRGDLHLLLVGDPGCLIGDERIVLGNGTVARLETLGESHLELIRTQVRLGAGSYRNGWATRFHRYEDQPILEVITETGKSIKGTHNHPLLVWNPSTRSGEWKRLDELRVGNRVRVARSVKCWKQALVPTNWTEPVYYHKSWHVRVPDYADESLAAIFGYILGDGWVTPRRVGLLVADEEADLAPKLSALFEKAFGTVPRKAGHRGRVTTYQVNRTPIAKWLKPLRGKRVPASILQSRDSVVASFLRWLYEADGSCFARGRGRTAITLRSTAIELLRDVQILLLRWGIHSSILWSGPPTVHLLRGKPVRGGPNGSLVIRRGESILRFAKHVGFVSAKKRTRLREATRYVRSRSRRWHGQNSERIVSIRSAGRSAVYDIEVPGPQRFIANGIISHNTAKSELLSYMSRLSPRGIYATGKAATAAGLTAAAVRDEFGEGRWTLEAGALVLADKGLACLHADSSVILDGQEHTIKSLFDQGETARAWSNGRPLEISPIEGTTLAFDLVTGSPVTSPVTLVARRWYDGPMVRVTLKSGVDLRLTPDHLMLEGESLRWRELQNLPARSRLVALQPPTTSPTVGRMAGMASLAGDTVLELLPEPRAQRAFELVGIAEVRIEDYRGFVYDLRVPETENFLCDGVVVHNCIDEIDKMNPNDRAAIHEAMEQQRISVAKAGITAVLQARCAVLGAANPKFGRFDETKYIAEQIDLPPTLLSRFDAIFSIIDRPESEKDRRLADHILRGHLVGEWLRRREEGREVPEANVEYIEHYAPHFDPIFFRKYVAYSKRISPVMKPEAVDAIRTKYLEIRKTGEAAGASVPITPRQLEAIIRLAEASARARLSSSVEAEDAERAVRITEYWMRRVAGEEGRFDIDIVQVGISASQREQIITLREIITELSTQSPLGAADYEDIARIASERGITSVRVDQWLKRWAEEGEVYSPSKNKYKLVERL